MRSRTFLLSRLVAVAIAALAVGAPAAAELIERTVAFVNRRPVLLSDVRLTKALLGLDDKDAEERTIEETLMHEEATRLLSAPPAEERVGAAVDALREKAGSFSPAALRRKAVAQIAISDYIDLRLRPLVRVDDEAVRRTFTERTKDDQAAPAFDDVQQGIRETLERRSLDRRIEEWVESIRRRAEIRRPKPVR
jgi:hypothetical protein